MNTEEKIYKFVKKNGKVPRTQISHMLNIPYYRCKYILEELVKKGKLKRIKTLRGTYYEVK
ncbi:MAG: hypothetical protein DRN14_02595 [Thermoplasmata archaeon]|nr:MAG: hypothetical protein DRN14_02595 [Thermoplasmata archaeon]